LAGQGGHSLFDGQGDASELEASSALRGPQGTADRNSFLASLTDGIPRMLRDGGPHASAARDGLLGDDDGAEEHTSFELAGKAGRPLTRGAPKEDARETQALIAKALELNRRGRHKA